MIWMRMAVAALGVGGPVALGVAAGRPALGALAAVGALAATGVPSAASQGDGTASAGAILRGAASTVGAVAAAGFAGAAVTGHGWGGAVALVLMAAVSALAGGLSRPMAELTTRFVTFMVITTGPARNGHPAAVAAVVAAGVAWGVLLALPLALALARRADDPPQRALTHATGDTARRRGASFVRRVRRGAWSATSRRYAVRLTACLGAAQGIALLWPHPTGSWISVTVVIVVRRQLTGAARRAVERAAGTAAGALAAAALPLWALTAWPFTLVVAGLAGLRPAVKEHHPALYAAVMTPLVLLLTGGAPAGLAGLRIADTAIGCALALGFGYLPWAVRRREQPHQQDQRQAHERDQEDDRADRAASRPDTVRSTRADVE
ncbi:FUSC family protein [Nonomuraea rhodomycinica]|uniref:FUSC family protein n=1 Tax=Nonomuraea rhodomycinica TaxID=1712872 RepID=A0A7Y6M943_9ACTN|nr:FUSC family protein [Nonomuraea rhodomycinica]NUW39242.1 FUSC family protein [Nonomuraea rhodomycinica]